MDLTAVWTAIGHAGGGERYTEGVKMGAEIMLLICFSWEGPIGQETFFLSLSQPESCKRAAALE